MTTPMATQPVYKGQFGTFTITAGDRQGVRVYRGSLMVAALCFGLGTLVALAFPEHLNWITGLYGIFWLALGVSLFTIHIYLEALHRLLQVFWAMGGLASVVIVWWSPQSLAMTVYDSPPTLLGIGFTFAALTGIYFKEAFCFNRLETKLLTPLVPLLLLGHLTGWLSPLWAARLLALWAILFVVFASRKGFQAIPDDIGDKSVFDYLRSQQQHS